MIDSEIDGHKGDPNDARCVHRESDKFGFVEVFRQVSRFYRVNRTKTHQKRVPSCGQAELGGHNGVQRDEWEGEGAL